MLPPAPYYERLQPQVLQGDIGYFVFTQLTKPGEANELPGSELPPTVKGIPVFEGMSRSTVKIGGGDYQIRHWTGFGVVVDVTSELLNSPLDSRVTVAPVVPSKASGLNWDTAAAGKYAGVLPLPGAVRGSIGADFPPKDWPDFVALPRSVTTVSRSIVEDGRMMTLSPRMAALLAAKLVEMFGERQWARMKHFANVEGQKLVEVDDADAASAAPTKGKWAVLTFENHERMKVFLSPAD